MKPFQTEILADFIITKEFNTDHVKYKSIENSYNSRYVKSLMNQFDMNVPMVLTEKLDGANLQLLITPEGSVSVGKRSAWVSEGEDFFDVWKTLQRYSGLIEQVTLTAQIAKAPIRLYGELYGVGINNRVSYGDGQTKYIRIFDAYIGETHLAPVELHTWLGDKFYAPVIGVSKDLLEGLNTNPEFVSKDGTTTGEGFVIRPYYTNYYLNGETVQLKVKAKSFAEVEQQKHKVKSLDRYDVNLLALNDAFKSYVTANRLKSVVSKEGPITETKQIGQYIKLLLNDALEDFKKDNNLTDLNEKDAGFIMNVGPLAAQLVKAELANS